MTGSCMQHPWGHAEERPDDCALIMADTGTARSYGQMMRNANRLSHWLIGLGLQEGASIALLMENCCSYFEICWAAKNAGLYYVCIPRQASVADARYMLENSGAKVLFASAALAKTAQAVCAEMSTAPSLLLVTGDTAEAANYGAEIALLPGERPPARRRGASLLYSSGTTGRPKGIKVALGDEAPEIPPLRHTMLVATYGYGPDVRLVVPGPFYHTSPLRFSMHVHRAGGCVIGFEKFDAEATLRAMARWRATHALLVPTMMIRMLKLPEAVRGAFDLSALRYAIHQAAPCPVAVKEAMFAWWGPIIHEMYGGTEGIGQTVIGPEEWLRHRGSVGRAPPGVELHIVGPDGAALGPHADGLIYMYNGRRFEYLDDRDKTAQAHHPKGWATLGDIGHVDEDGYLYLTDRQSNLIITGGVNVYPQEAENLLIGHPEVADAAVFGVPHGEFGEEVKAVVVPQSELGTAEQAALATRLIAYCRQQLNPVKCPRSVEFAAALPRSEVGKIMKRELQRLYGRASLVPGTE